MSDLLDSLQIPAPEEEPLPKSPSFTKVPLPPATKISAGGFVTAAIADGDLYLWRESPEGDFDARYPIIASLGDLDSPALQQILDSDGKSLKIKDVAVGRDHIVALAVDGSLFSVGRGWYGELGIGDRVFELEVEEKEGHHYDEEDAFGFTETWVRMNTDDLLAHDMEWASVMTGFQSTFALAQRKA